MTTTLPVGAVTVETVLDPNTVTAAWIAYRTAMAPIDARAAQRHLLTAVEFADLACNPNIDWYVHRTGGELDGMAAVATTLDAAPIASPRFFARRFPDAGRVWYVLFLAVAKPAQRGGVFDDLAKAIRVEAGRDGCLVVLDVCATRDRQGFPQAIAAVAGVPAQRLDVQVTYGYEIPADQ